MSSGRIGANLQTDPQPTRFSISVVPSVLTPGITNPLAGHRSWSHVTSHASLVRRGPFWKKHVQSFGMEFSHRRSFRLSD